MIDYKNSQNINEYDEIIMNWYEPRKIENMRYLCIEDTEKKCWIVYDSTTGLYKETQFGVYTECVIHDYINGNKEAIHHNKMIESAKKHNIDFDEEKYSLYYESSKEALSSLFHILTNLSRWHILANKGQLVSNSGKNINKDELKMILVNEWRKYRLACFPSQWGEYIGNEAEFEKATIENINKCVTKYFIYYYDYITFIDKNGNPRTGRCFLTFNDIYLFYWDLYHVLITRLVDAPHICPRCNTLFFSNNNKATYCDDCKEEPNIIRNENRKKSVRYIHKKIYDKLNNSKFYDNVDKEMFLAESNYYWDIVKGKEVQKRPLFTAKIENEADYRKWLDEKLQSYK